MKFIGQKIAALAAAAAVILTAVPNALADNSSNAAYAAFDGVSAQCVNMTAKQAVPAPDVEEHDGRSGWRLDPSAYSRSYIRCNIDDDFIYGLNGECTPVAEITYYDGGFGGFSLNYDSRSGGKSQFVQLQNSGEWKTKTFYLYDARFANGVYADDFRIETSSGVYGTSEEPVVIGGVTVTKSEKSAPLDISVSTGKTGNIFFEGDNIKFDVSYTDITGGSFIFRVDYEVEDYSGNVVKTKSKSVSANPSANDSVTFTNLPYGVYTLNVKVSGGGAEQEYRAEFSHARKADKTNYHFGTNIHYDDDIYDKNDIKAMSDLIKNSGFGFVRSSLRWWQWEPQKGVYTVPENVLYANQYIDSIGLEMLGIVYIDNPAITSHPYYVMNEEQLEAFRDYCEFAASELSGYTDYFCMLNEINLDGGYVNNEEEYVEIAKKGYEGIKAGNENAFINGGSLAGWQRQYANKTYELGILDYCDSYSMHTYSQTEGPEADYLYRSVTDHRSNLKKYDTTGTKEAWITEAGWPTRAADNRADEAASQSIAKKYESASELQQAKWYARSLAINGDKSRIDKYFFYSAVDDGMDKFDIQNNFGIIRAKAYDVPFAAKPAYIAVCAFNDLVGDAEFAGDMITDGTGYANKYIKPDGSGITCVWASETVGQTGGVYNYKTNAPYVAVYDMYGNAEYIENTSGTCQIAFTDEPVYVADAYEKPVEPEPEEPDDGGDDDISDGGMSVSQNGESVPSVWFIKPDTKIDVSFITDKPAGTEMSVICAAYNNGILKGLEIQKTKAVSDVISVSFSGDGIINADKIKLMVFDGLDGLVPLRDAYELSIFDTDMSVTAKTHNGRCTVSGRLKSRNKGERLTAAVFSEETVQSDLTETGVVPFMLYQDQLESGENGAYEFTFEYPDSYKGKTSMIIISTPDETVQSVIPAFG